MKEIVLKEVGKEVTPVYIWKTGESMYLSKKEKLVADTYMKSMSYMECERVLKGEGFEVSWQSCKRWLERGNVRGYIRERVEEGAVAGGWTRERWLAVMTRHLRGEARLKDGDLYGMNLIAKVMGWEAVQGSGVVNNINILQSNGRE